MNTILDLRQALAEDARRLQPAPGLESRVLRQAFSGSLALPRRPARLVHVGRSAGALAAALLVVLILLGILAGGLLLRGWGVTPALPPGHFLPRADSGMVSATTGWVSGVGQPMQRTTDGGAHWRYADPASYSYVSSQFDATFFLDGNHAWLTTSDASNSLLIAVFATADGGKTWRKGASVDVGVTYRVPRLYFSDPAHGWMLVQSASPTRTEDDLYGSVDGGMHWVRLATNTHDTDTTCDWTGVSFSSPLDGWIGLSCPAGNSTALLGTHDGGTTWFAQSGPQAAAGLSCPCSLDVPTVLDRTHSVALVYSFAPGATSANERLVMTADGGNTWQPLTSPGEVIFVYNFVDPKHGWAVAGSAAIFGRDASGRFPVQPGVKVPLYRTDDGGLTWVPVPTNLPFSDATGRLGDLYFVDSLDGFAERSGVGLAPQFYKTADGGRHWTGLIPIADDCPIAVSSTCTSISSKGSR